MIAINRSITGRRGRSRRLLLFRPALLLLAALHGAGSAGAQETEAIQIVRRQARLARESDGGYRVIEAFDVADSRAAGDTLPVPLAIISEGAENVQALAADVPPTRLVYDPNHLVLLGGPPAPEYRLVFTYRLAANTELLMLRALPAVNELVIDVDRGNVDAAPGPSLSAVGDGGTSTRPSRRYTARDLPPGAAAHLRLIRRRTGWRERLAVLITVSAAAGLTGLTVWKRRAVVGRKTPTERASAGDRSG